MKYLVLGLIALVVGIMPANAQSLEFAEPPITKELIPNAQANFGVHYLNKIKIRNKSGKNLDHVKVRMIRLETTEGHNSTFCWTLCYAPPIGQTFTTTDDLPMQAGEVTDAFYPAMFIDEGFGVPTRGLTRLHFTFFVANDPNSMQVTGDSIGYTVLVDVGGVTSVEDLETPLRPALSDVFPSPARDIAKVQYELPKQRNKAELVVYNLLGKTVHRQTLTEQRGTAHIPASNLPQGMYITSLIVDGQRMQTKRFLIQR